MKTGIEPAKPNQNWDLSNKQLDFFLDVPSGKLT